jgi:hypothetical protein
MRLTLECRVRPTCRYRYMPFLISSLCPPKVFSRCQLARLQMEADVALTRCAASAPAIAVPWIVVKLQPNFARFR